MKNLKNQNLKLQIRLLKKLLGMLSVAAIVFSCNNSTEEEKKQENDSLTIFTQKQKVADSIVLMELKNDSITKITADSIALAKQEKSKKIKPTKPTNQPIIRTTKYGVIPFNEKKINVPE